MPKGTDINARTQDKLRTSIKAAEIIKKLTSHILSNVKMTNTQVRAAEILLRKVQPDLLATAISDARDTALPVLQIVRNTSTKDATDPSRSKVLPVPAAEPDQPATGTDAA